MGWAEGGHPVDGHQYHGGLAQFLEIVATLASELSENQDQKGLGKRHYEEFLF